MTLYAIVPSMTAAALKGQEMHAPSVHLFFDTWLMVNTDSLAALPTGSAQATSKVGRAHPRHSVRLHYR